MFSREQVPVFLESGSFDEGEVVKVKLRVMLTPQLASEFLPGDGQPKASIYKTLDGLVRPYWRDSTWSMDIPAQRLIVFATPDSEPSICFDHVRIAPIVKAKLIEGQVALYFTASIGPCGPMEREAVASWFENDRFINFVDADATFSFEEPIDLATLGIETIEGADIAAPPLKALDDDEDAHRYPDTSKAGRQKRLATRH